MNSSTTSPHYKHYAGFTKRFFAWIIDFIILSCLIITINWLFRPSMPNANFSLFSMQTTAKTTVFAKKTTTQIMPDTTQVTHNTPQTSISTTAQAFNWSFDDMSSRTISIFFFFLLINLIILINYVQL